MNIHTVLFILAQVVLKVTASCDKADREELQMKYLNQTSYKSKDVSVFSVTKSTCKTDIDAKLKEIVVRIDRNRNKFDEKCLANLQVDLNSISGSHKKTSEEICEKNIHEDVEKVVGIIRKELASIIQCVRGEGSCEDIDNCCRKVVDRLDVTKLNMLAKNYTECMEETCGGFTRSIHKISEDIKRCLQ